MWDVVDNLWNMTHQDYLNLGVESGNVYTNSLMMFGLAGCGTGFHLDWASAVNVAFAVGNVSTDATLAVWTFIHPNVLLKPDLLTKLTDWLSVNIGEDQKAFLALERHKKKLLTPAQSEALQAYMGVELVTIINQKHGEVVKAPAGWAHTVTNVEVCFKVAYDHLILEQFPTYALIHSRVTGKWSKASNAADYTGWLSELDNVMARLMQNTVMFSGYK